MQNTFTPSTYQQAIFDFIQTGTGNAVVNAVAGSGKTTTIVKGLGLIPEAENKQIYFLAFGKAIADEIRSRVPAYVNVSTLHSLGAKALLRSRKSIFDEKKVWKTTDMLRNDWHNEDPTIDGNYLNRVRKLVDLYRLNLATSELELQQIARKHGIEVLNGEVGKAMQTLRFLSRDTHDFVDMLYYPASDPSIKMPYADWIFIDECQDLNKAQQALFSKLIGPNTRFIAVGDPHQAIYGFAGADEESFNSLKAFSNTIELPLSMNYRCGSDIIEFINELFPEIAIVAYPGAPKGKVDQKASYRTITDGDMVLCRNTAPLVRMCLEMIKSHKKAYVKGGDIGKTLANMVTRSNARTITDFEFWLGRELGTISSRLSKKYPGMTAAELQSEPTYSIMADKIEVFEAIIDSTAIGTPSELVYWINNLFAEEKAGICFSSAHKSKGLENRKVFIIEPELMPSRHAKTVGQKIQEENLMYVAFTRGKEYLGFVTDWTSKRNN